MELNFLYYFVDTDSRRITDYKDNLNSEHQFAYHSLQDHTITFPNKTEFTNNLDHSTNIIRLNSKLNKQIYSYPISLTTIIISAFVLTLIEFQTPFVQLDYQNKLNLGENYLHGLFTYQFVGVMLGTLASFLMDYVGRRRILIGAYALISVTTCLILLTDNYAAFLLLFMLQAFGVGIAFVTSIVFLFETSYNRLHTIMLFFLSCCFAMMCFMVSWHMLEYEITQSILSVLALVNSVLFYFQQESILYYNSWEQYQTVCTIVNAVHSNKLLYFYDLTTSEFNQDIKIAYDVTYYKTYSFKKDFLKLKTMNLIQHPYLQDYGWNPFYYVWYHFSRFYVDSFYRANLKLLLEFGTFCPILYMVFMPMIPDYYEYQQFVSKPSYNFISLNSFILLTSGALIMYILLLPKYNIDNIKIKRVISDSPFTRVHTVAYFQLASWLVSLVLLGLPLLNTYFNLRMRDSADLILPPFVTAVYTGLLLTKLFFISLLFDNTFVKWRGHDMAMILFMQLKVMKLLHIILFYFWSNYMMQILIFILLLSLPVLYFAYTLYKYYNCTVIEND